MNFPDCATFRRASLAPVALVLMLASPAIADPLFRAPFRAYSPQSAEAVRSVALGDLNGDGALDLVVGGDGGIAVLINAGDAEFGPPSYLTTLDYTSAVVVRDLDGDDHLDLVVGNRNSSAVSVFRGRGDGTFLARADYATGPDPRWIAIGDVDGDHHLDLVVANTESFYGRSVSTLLGNGDATFRPRIDTPMAGVSPSSVALADFDEDGRLDVVAGYEGGATFVYVMRGAGDGRFGALEGYDSGYNPITVATGDVNEDGHSDFVVGGAWSGNVSIHFGRGDGTFLPKFQIPMPGAAFVTLGDLDRDGHLDVVSPAAVLRGLGDGTFSATIPFMADRDPATVAIGDLTGDGWPDLVTANPYPGTVSVILGAGHGAFAQEPSVPVSPGSGGIAAGDIDADGRVDLVVSTGTQYLSILLGMGDGGFSARRDITSTALPTAAALTDLNHDGSLDLVTVSSHVTSTMLGSATGDFGPQRDFATGPGSYTMAIGDFNEDALPDVVTANEGVWSPDPRGGFLPDSSVSVLLGLGDGTLASRIDLRTGILPNAVWVADLNQDGHEDIAVPNLRSSTISVLLGNGDGTFRPRIDSATASRPSAMAIADFDGDGTPDIAIAHPGSVSTVLGNGDGTFRPGVESSGISSPWWIAAGDWNDDAIQDLAVTEESTNTVHLLTGNGDGTFSDAGRYGAGTGPEQGAVVDLNEDGRMDIVVSNHYGASITPLLNLAGSVTSTQLSLVACEAAPGLVRLSWYGTAVADGIVAERRSANEPWRVIKAPNPEGQLLILEDDTVLPGGRYAYRLRAAEILSGETWVDVPVAKRLSLSGSLGAGTGGISLTLTTSEPACIDVFDPAGRRVLRRTLEGLGPGEHEIALPAVAGWAPGLYFARLVQGRQSARARWCIVR